MMCTCHLYWESLGLLEYRDQFLVAYHLDAIGVNSTTQAIFNMLNLQKTKC